MKVVRRARDNSYTDVFDGVKQKFDKSTAQAEQMKEGRCGFCE
jgi:hypothetical protein